MKKITINKIVLDNFKGQSNEINLKPRTVITGYNGAGKTTIYNALLWCLTGKDSTNKANNQLFDNRTKLTHETPPAAVAVTMTIDNVQHTLKRIATPKFTRPKGSTEYVKAASDDYTFEVDGLKYKSNEFNDWISYQIAPADKLMYLLDGDIFALEAMDSPTTARKKLVELLGGKFEFNDKKFAPIIERVKEIGIDKFINECNERIRTANARLNDLPVQIKTMKGIIGDLEGFNELHKELWQNEKKIRRAYMEVGNRRTHSIIDKEMRNLDYEINELNEKIATIKQKALNEKVCPMCGNVITDDEVMKFQSELKALNEELKKKRKQQAACRKEFVSTPKNIYDELQASYHIVNEIEANKKNIEKYKAEKVALVKERIETSKLLAENERNKMLAKEYEQDYATMLSDEINKMLDGTRIEMFEVQKNGERKPSCVITDRNAVKYSTLNFASRLLCNIELSRLFCKLLEVDMPCFVDECSVFDSNHLPNIEGTQMIYMKCADTELKIEEC